jgi:hypothetical protein
MYVRSVDVAAKLFAFRRSAAAVAPEHAFAGATAQPGAALSVPAQK